MPQVTLDFDAILFDMDGTLVDSTDGVVGAWEHFKEKYPGLNVDQVLSSSHGVRTVENLKLHCSITDPDELEREARRFEEAIVAESTKNGRHGIVALPGVKAIMALIGEFHKLPKPKWAICTSATIVYATAALTSVGIPIPEAFVVSEDVEKGKPEPDPYLLGAKRAGVDPARCLVVEDAPAGVRSGQAAGCKTLGLITSHSREQMEEVAPDYLVKNLSKVTMKPTEGGVQVVIDLD
ncbi:phosphatase [Epithele typhae]|uniref:phosphatase n=1 Tax=Epithele typhae TaxID=378194 RepID=UPI0020086FAA|nr:phosphatase [Epithele typhae]XP_047876560.1 phosphatase [Epithele typhae]KAH9927185.1 phosphatase [Epithele typhae]KAH9927196.1 phosphatase [Epithele typhae]